MENMVNCSREALKCLVEKTRGLTDSKEQQEGHEVDPEDVLSIAASTASSLFEMLNTAQSLLKSLSQREELAEACHCARQIIDGSSPIHGAVGVLCAIMHAE